jgi:hypothetical protein
MTQRVLQHKQLAMFMSPDEVIDGAWKGDSHIDRGRNTPRQQWERPDPGGIVETESLRDRKLRQITERTDEDEEHGLTPYTDRLKAGAPVKLFHDEETYGAHPILDDGHHRLAYAERNKTPYIAVQHSGPHALAKWTRPER